MPKGIELEWPGDDDVVRLAGECTTQTQLAERLAVKVQTLYSRLRMNPALRERVVAALRHQAVEIHDAPEREFDQALHAMLKGKRKPVSVEALADTLDVSPKRVREALDRLRAGGYRVPDETGGHVQLEQVVFEEPTPDQKNLTTVSPRLLDGDTLRVGVVSDTHLSSKECALEELECAYDVFEREGIQEVWHPGDWTAGLGIYRTQAQDLTRHTYEDQVDHLEARYPQRDGIVTRGIAGNHDIEGEFGKIGANPVTALAARRPDVEYLGDYSAWLELPNGSWVHLLHGRGGMSYSFSYKAQKLADAYPAGRKPAALMVGHWHVAGWIEQRGVQILWPACFEWQTSLLKRIGLQPTVGFWIVEMTLADDGSLVRFRPQLHRFWEGREVQAA
jgi:predicted phosphodiesterase/biotin operon repressor